MTKLEMYAVKKLMVEMFEEGAGCAIFSPDSLKNECRKNDTLKQVIGKAISESGLKVTDEENQNDRA